MGELEVAAVSCEGFLPPQAMQGLVDLFAYEEPIPSCEWKAGSRSLRRLSRNLENVISRLGEGEDELGDLGHLRKVEKCGPLSTFLKLRQLWSHKTADWTGPQERMTTLTPSYHAENYSPDDNRFDLRPFLFPAAFEAQFEAIDEVVKACKGS
eukprot:g520.t1